MGGLSGSRSAGGALPLPLPLRKLRPRDMDRGRARALVELLVLDDTGDSAGGGAGGGTCLGAGGGTSLGAGVGVLLGVSARLGAWTMMYDLTPCSSWYFWKQSPIHNAVPSSPGHNQQQ